MIKKLTASNEQEVMDLLKPEALQNLFILGDLENFGYETDFLELWGDFDEAENLRACMLRFGKNFLPYSKEDSFDVAGFAEIIKNRENTPLNISGIPRVTSQFEKELPELVSMRQDSHFCKCTNASMMNANREVIIRSAKADDVAAIIEMRKGIEEFGERNDNEALIIEQLEQGSKRIYTIEQRGEIVSVAESSAENSFSAMVTGVATRKEYRGQGFASTIMKRLCCDLLAEGKTPCLFYNNPVAGKMYHQIGFEDVSDFVLYR
ncbi:GNAT family N-acetyltransferase [Listeria costaricensis]|uniref:GNAT family N-acetyltransferase n=1 Tax=Listeria costaricensis TaxID=2026604 RepID=UPI000C0899A3|nr:GNAT family N-acetyltransferase [Listeria costaricensis]